MCVLVFVWVFCLENKKNTLSFESQNFRQIPRENDSFVCVFASEYFGEERKLKIVVFRWPSSICDCIDTPL